MRINFYKLYITKSYAENFFEICVYYNKITKSISLLYLRIMLNRKHINLVIYHSTPYYNRAPVIRTAGRVPALPSKLLDVTPKCRVCAFRSLLFVPHIFVFQLI